MMSFKDPGFSNRLASAASAKKSALDKFRAKPAVDDPAVLERQSERAAIGAARNHRAASRASAKEAERMAGLEREARDTAEGVTRRQRESIEAAEQAERDVALEVERKAARDARYAARKARR